MVTADKPVEQFFQQWAGDFGRALEMNTGKSPGVSMTAIDSTPPGDLFWWRQTFSSDGTEFGFWSGAPESTWAALGEILSESDPASCRAIYQEALYQAGSQTALAAGGDGEVTCGSGTESLPPEGRRLSWMTISFELGAATPLQIFAVVEQAGLLEPVSQKDEEEDLASSPMLDRLREVELPISIELGSATLTLREALGMKIGSVVSLNREAGETVALLVHDTVVATGEIVEVKGQYGVRIRQIMSRHDRLRLCPN